MAIRIRRAEIRTEREALIEFLSIYLSERTDEQRYDWLYNRNPEGEARAWVAVDEGSGQIAGVAAAFPRRIVYAEEMMKGYVLGDFCIHPVHRSLGPALALQRACLEDLSEESAAFVFDFPSAAMQAVYARLHVEGQERLIRFAKPLRADRKMAERMHLRFVARGLTSLANASLRMRDRFLRGTSNWTVTSQAGPWGKEFTKGARSWSQATGCCVARTAEYLNWRYHEHPYRRYEMLTARQDDRLGGYLVYHREEQSLQIDDLLAEGDDARRTLLLKAVAIGREHRVDTLSATWLSSHPGSQLLRKCGFRPRESRPVILLSLPQLGRSRGCEPKDPWYLMDGDRES